MLPGIGVEDADGDVGVLNDSSSSHPPGNEGVEDMTELLGRGDRSEVFVEGPDTEDTVRDACVPEDPTLPVPSDDVAKTGVGDSARLVDGVGDVAAVILGELS